MSKEAKKDRKEKKERKRPSRGARVAVRLIAVLIVIALAFGAYHVGYAVFRPEPVARGGEPETCVITVDEGEDIESIAEELKEAGMIRSVLILRVQDRIFDYGLVPGTFEVNSGMTSIEILSWLSDSNHTLADDAPAEEETEPVLETQTEPQTETLPGEDTAEGA